VTAAAGPSVRLDRWLTAVRVYKSRTLAQEACAAGRVFINAQPARSSHLVRIGDEVSAHTPRRLSVLEVVGLAEKRLGADKARLLYVDRSPPPPPKERVVAQRERGAGRPTKAERRAIDRLRAR